MIRRRIVCHGTVQGVGFRPAVYRLACDLGLAGSVRNDAEGACIEIEGELQRVELFRASLDGALVAPAQLSGTEESELVPTGEREFRIEASNVSERSDALVPPDVRICDACRAELDDPQDRRHGYAFTTCTHCGPRFTLVEALPFDRERTSMARFEPCADCAAEYADPRNRRFHAQTLSCPRCGPQLELVDPRGNLLGGGEHALQLARAALAAGQIVAVKGLGGFQLACRADDDAAVRRLRALKRRRTKPFAIMLRDLGVARALLVLRAEDEALLASDAAPILLAPARANSEISAEVAPHLGDLGAMLPTTPLHVELFRTAPYRALVMTSGNSCDEPICRTNDEARTRLASLADMLLLHDREIVRRCDDSLVRTQIRGHQAVRRSRGYVPEPIGLAQATPQAVLALGAHLQNCVALALGDKVFCSQHVGDLDGEAAREFQEEVARGLEDFLEVEARVIAVDLHPDYPSTWFGERLAAARGARLLRVQHHLAHACAVLGEHGAFPAVGERAAAIVLDGTGFGSDGTAWGAEWLCIDGRLGWQRVACAEPLPLVGGERAVREPWRVAAAALASAGMEQSLGQLPIGALVARRDWELVARLSRKPGFPAAGGAGRLFEAAGALIGLCVENTWEGEAAARLEALATGIEGQVWPEVVLNERRDRLPFAALLVALARRLQAGQSAASCAADFHASFAALCAQLATLQFGADIQHVALAGGCFVNRLLVDQLTRALEQAGFVVLRSEALPCGDGGLAYGQATVAGLSLARGVRPQEIGGA